MRAQQLSRFLSNVESFSVVVLPCKRGFSLRIRGISSLFNGSRQCWDGDCAMSWGRCFAPFVAEGVSIVSSGHSIDILVSAASKTNVIRQMADRFLIPLASILAIGDQGRHPGNDLSCWLTTPLSECGRGFPFTKYLFAGSASYDQRTKDARVFELSCRLGATAGDYRLERKLTTWMND